MLQSKTAIIGAVVLVGAATLFVFQRQLIERHRRAAMAARAEAETAAQRAEEVRRQVEATAHDRAAELSREERLELLRLRSEVTRLREQLKHLAPATGPTRRDAPRGDAPSPPPALPVPDSGVGGEFLPADQWADVGFGTPEAAVQTIHWAMKHGNLERMQQALLLPPGAVPEGAEPIGLDALAFLPATGGGNAAATAAMPGPNDSPEARPLPELKGSRIVSREELSPESVRLTVENEHADGTRLQAQMDFRRAGNDWKLAPTMLDVRAPEADGQPPGNGRL